MPPVIIGPRCNRRVTCGSVILELRVTKETERFDRKTGVDEAPAERPRASRGRARLRGERSR
jgi:hypothetical protein